MTQDRISSVVQQARENQQRERDARRKIGTEGCRWIDDALRLYLIEPDDGSEKTRAEFWEIMAGVIESERLARGKRA